MVGWGIIKNKTLTQIRKNVIFGVSIGGKIGKTDGRWPKIGYRAARLLSTFPSSLRFPPIVLTTKPAVPRQKTSDMYVESFDLSQAQVDQEVRPDSSTILSLSAILGHI